MKKITDNRIEDKVPNSLKCEKSIQLDQSFSGEKNRFKLEEFITLLLGVTVYALWLILTASFNSIPFSLAFLAGGLVICWHGSFQHEAIHGHPFKSSFLNTALAYPPLGLIIPYPIYKELHTKHHKTDKITDPFDDPESFYYSNFDWEKSSGLTKHILTFNNTLLGRLCLGPIISSVFFFRSEGSMLVKGDLSHLKHWVLHVISIALLAIWIVTICGISPIAYILCFVYPGIAFTLLRSFAEHKPASENDKRSAIIKSNALIQLLYLNNNFHFIHHRLPWLAWYKIPIAYTKHREEILESNDGFYFKGYTDLFKLYFLNPKDSPLHPQYQQKN